MGRWNSSSDFVINGYLVNSGDFYGNCGDRKRNQRPSLWSQQKLTARKQGEYGCDTSQMHLWGPSTSYYYLDEFTFRFIRRSSRKRGKLFYRLVQQALEVDPVYWADVSSGLKTSRKNDWNVPE